MTTPSPSSTSPEPTRHPLLDESALPYGLPDFSAFGDEDLEPAIRTAIDESGVRVVFTDLQAGSCTMAARRVLRDRQDVVFVAGAALAIAARRVREKATRIAAHLLEVGEADVEWTTSSRSRACRPRPSP